MAQEAERPGGSRRLDWDAYCRELVPELLMEWGTPADRAEAVGSDIAKRADGFARSGKRAREVLRASFLEEVVEYQPQQAPRTLLTAVTVIVRCSLLEDEHAGGVVEASGIHGLTELAAAPLWEYLNTNYNMAPGDPPAGVFADVHLRYPRAWAALAHVDRRNGEGGRSGYGPPRGIVPSLPADAEVVDTDTTDADMW